MKYSLYRHEDYKTSQWMGGKTTELAIYPKTSKYLDRNSHAPGILVSAVAAHTIIASTIRDLIPLSFCFLYLLFFLAIIG